MVTAHEGHVVIRSFDFDYTQGLAALAAGVPLFTPVVGSQIENITVRVTTAWNGTTPKFDIGTFSGGNTGLWAQLGQGAVDLTSADAAVTNNAGLATNAGTNSASLLLSAVSVGILASAGAGAAVPRKLPIQITAANPLLLVVSQNGQKSGTATTSTTGAATVTVTLREFQS
jgi:hypothetical protein